MTKTHISLLQAGTVLIGGLLAAGGLVVAFTQSAEAKDSDRARTGSPLEVIISDNGRVLVRGAEITAVTDSTITARSEWGQSALTWTVRTDGDTHFVEKKGSSMELADLEDGDFVSFSGTLDADAETFTVDADTVKNWSEDQDARAEVKAKLETRWDNWKEKFPIFNWFKDKKDK